MRYWFLILLFGFANTGIANESVETSPCPGLVSMSGYQQFEQSLVITDDAFSSIEDCEKLNRFYFLDSPRDKTAFVFASLNNIVDATWQPVNEEAPLLLMDAFLSWLKSLGLTEHADSLRGFLEEYMPAEESVELFFEIVLWLIVIATVFLVLREFYLAGLLRLPVLGKKMTSQMHMEQRPGLSWEQVLKLPLREQISALLRFSIEQLIARDLVPASQNYTNRELKTRLQQTDPAKAQSLEVQIALTEPVIYGGQPVNEEVIGKCRQKAQEIGDA